MRIARKSCRGAALVSLAAALSIGLAATLAVGLAGHSARLARERESERALASARAALLAYAAARPVDTIVGPGYLPCPDLDNDGWAESTCGSQNGDSGQSRRLGRLPWKTLGIPELRDGHGERLWYAVSSKYKGLLNCTVSASCLDMSPDAAIGTITVRDSSGSIAHDGRLADLYRANAGGVAAVVFAPGPALERVEDASGAVRRRQDRACPPGACDALGRCTTAPASDAPACEPANYLDKAPGVAFADEDNANFNDRNDAAGRPANANGFIRGPVRLPDGTLAVNDRLAEITYDDIVPRVMQRVAHEVATCLRVWAARSESGGRLPAPAPTCRQAGGDRARAWEPQDGAVFGRVPMLAFTGCAIANEPAPNWWLTWRRHVFYAIADRERAVSMAPVNCDDPGSCLQVVSPGGWPLATGKRAAVIVAGPPLASASQSHAAGADATVSAWLEDAHIDLERRNPNPAAPDCPAASIAPCSPGLDCSRLVRAPRSAVFNDVLATIP